MPGPVYVSFGHPINAQSLQAILKGCETIVSKKYDPVHLLFTTVGGQVNEGIMIYNALRAMPFKLVIYNVGNVDSIGNVVFLAGEERYASPRATFMFHGVGFDIAASTRVEEKNLHELLDGVRASQKRMSDIITARTSILEADVEKLFLQQATRDATWAKSTGIIQDVQDVQIPQGAEFYNINL